MSDAASFDAIMQCNLLEVFCEALDAAIIVTDKLDAVSFASVRLLHHFAVSENAIAPGTRARDLYAALYDAGCRFGSTGKFKDKSRETWVAERVTSAWKERVDAIEPSGADRWFRIVSRRFSSGLGLTVIQDISEHKKKEKQWRIEHERVRTTEEILDTLPVAIAVRDRNLNFVAVNQQFSKMLKISPENVLGRGLWDVFEPELARKTEEQDWQVLATGTDREIILLVERPGAEPTRFLHRARRVGKPGNHYVSMSFDEFPAEDTLPIAVANMRLQVSGGGDETDTPAGQPLATGQDISGLRRKVVYVYSGARNEPLVTQARLHGIELCIICDEAEFRAFLPAIKAAGIALDLVVIEPAADFAFATLSARHGIRHRMLSPGADVMESIIDAFERRSRLLPAPEILAPVREPAEEERSSTVDVLAVEDNAINRMVIEQILEGLGVNFHVTGSGQETLDRIRELQPKIMLVDVTLPDMEVGELMRSLEPLFRAGGIKPPVIGLIATDGIDQRQICQAAGMIDALPKPLSPEAIDRMLRKHLFHESPDAKLLAKSVA